MTYQGINQSTITLTLLLLLSFQLTFSQEIKDESADKGIFLHLYAIPGISNYQLDQIQNFNAFSTLPQTTTTYNLGAGFSQRFNDRFCVGLEFYFGTRKIVQSEYNYETRTFETPLLIGYRIFSKNGLSLTPKIGVNMGTMYVASIDKTVLPFGPTTHNLKQTYTQGRLGVVAEYELKSQLVFSVNTGYNFSFDTGKGWQYLTFDTNSTVADKLNSFYFALTIGSRININKH